MRKEKAPFNIFSSKNERAEFFGELTELINNVNFVLVSCVIEKHRLQHRYQNPGNPYHLALSFGLERVYKYLQEKRQDDRLTHIIVERRGKKEDDKLELEFRRIYDGANWFKRALPFDICFADKKTNSAGLQLADLVARPVGMSVLRPQQVNRAFEALRPKFYCQGGRNNVGHCFEGWGLKEVSVSKLPDPESEKPR